MNRKEIEPPAWAERLLRLYCSERFVEEIAGDLREWYALRVKRQGVFKARLFYFIDVIRFFRTFRLRSLNSKFNNNNMGMIGNSLKVSVRSLRRRAGYSFINIFGLSVGISAAILVSYYVKTESGYDRFWPDHDRIYRVYSQRTGDFGIRKDAGGPVPMAKAMQNEFASVEQAVRFWRASRPAVSFGEKAFPEEKFYFTDAQVFDLFPVEFIAGNPATALTSPNSIAITRATATKYFGSEEPLGKVLKYRAYPGGELEFAVTAVLEDLPVQTHLDFEFLASINSHSVESDNWGSFKPVFTYLKLTDQSQALSLNGLLPAFAARHLADRVEEDPQFKLAIQNIKDLHLHAESSRDMKPGASVSNIYLFTSIGALILFVAIVNFVNLSTALASTRAKEVGVRKSVGSNRRQLVFQFILETGLTTFIAAIAAVIIIALLSEPFYQLSGVKFALSALLSPFYLALLCALIVVMSLLAGVYPAIFLASVKAPSVLRGNTKLNFSLGIIRKSMVGFQFLVSTVLITGTFVIDHQLGFIYSKPIGIDKSQVLVIPYGKSDGAFLNKLRSHTGISLVGVSQQLPVNDLNYDGRPVQPEGMNETIDVQSCFADQGFAETYQMEFLSGRNLDNERASDESAFVINETAVRDFGWNDVETAIGKEMVWSNSKRGHVVGVVKDFHLNSLHDKIPPVVIHLNKKQNWWKEFISIRLNSGNLTNSLSYIEREWKSQNAGLPYEYFFIDDSFDALHQADSRFHTAISYFSILAITIAGMGLFALASFTIARRKKEIGIRKVLGAGSGKVALSITSEYSLLLITSFLLSIPLSAWLMESWLDSFAYRTSIEVSIIIKAGLAVGLISLITVGLRSLKAASANPVDSIRYE